MIIFFHGLESSPSSNKSKYLETELDAYCPEMNYHNPDIFNIILAEVKNKRPSLLIGSSMGGWFAYCISTLTGIPTLLFNPAFHSRRIDPSVHFGNHPSNHIIIFGKNDAVIDTSQSVGWINKNGIGSFEYHYENHTHRTPINSFKRWVSKYTLNENS
jgi:alpha/beta superfamily hydrolase